MGLFLERNALIEKLFNVQFIGLTPVENTGQVSWKGEGEGALEALTNYLSGLYGPGNFKIVYFNEAEDLDPEGTPFVLPNTPPTSKVLN